ncbi:signal transduction histidine kinase [Nocardia sp. GAS34]|uniref:sensor histidine kinase n=1 Tax=unclassified Nocardia TaxID=2637762 RepID=UPI003D236A8C
MLAATTGGPRDLGTVLPTVDVWELLGTVIARHGANTHDITVDCPATVTVRADPDDLDRIVTNLLDNALTHGGPPVDIRLTGTRTGSVDIRVRDHGRGMDPSFLPHAFERFTRADTALTRGGSGLGLAIVRTLAARNHATVTAANHPDGGLEMTITLSSPPDPGQPA